MINGHTGYLSHAMGDPDDMVAAARYALKNVKFDTMVGTGLSGALVVPIIARAMGKHWMLIRKPNDGSHSSYRAEGKLDRRWIFVDDLIDSGDTLRRVLDQVSALCKKHAHATTFAGSYLYEPFVGSSWLPRSRTPRGIQPADWRP